MSSVNTPLVTEFWQPFPTAGVALIMPSTVKNGELEAAIEAGKMSSRGHTVNLECLQFRCGLRVHSFFEWNNLDLNPSCGISGMMIGNSGKGIKDIVQLHVFSNVENEFGLYGGISPTYSYHAFSICIPVLYNRILSIPERLTMITCALQIGYTFK